MNNNKWLIILLIITLLLTPLHSLISFADGPLLSDRFEIIWLDHYYDRLYRFSNGVAVVGNSIANDSNRQSNMQLIDTNGQLIGQPFKAFTIVMDDNSVNIAYRPLYSGNGVNFITRTGVPLNLNPNTIFNQYYHGMTSVYSERLQSSCVLDQAGQVVLKMPKEVEATVFKERDDRLIIQHNAKNQDISYGLIDLTGNIIIPINYSNMFPTKNIISAADYSEKVWKYTHYDYDGKQLFTSLSNQGYLFKTAFVGETALVSKNDKVGIIDETGKVLIEPKYDSISQIGQGYNIIHLDTFDYLVSPKGNLTKIEQGEHITLYRAGEEAIKAFPNNTYGGSGYLNYKGEKITTNKYSYDRSGNFIDGVAYAYSENNYHYIDLTGNEIVTSLEQATDFNQGHALFNYQGKTGILVDKLYKKTASAVVYDDVTTNMKKQGHFNDQSNFTEIAIALNDVISLAQEKDTQELQTPTSEQQILVLDDKYKNFVGQYGHFYVVEDNNSDRFIIDNNGQLVGDQSISYVTDNHSVVNGKRIYSIVISHDYYDKKYGLIDEDTNVLLPIKYDKIVLDEQNAKAFILDGSQYQIYNFTSGDFENNQVFDDVIDIEQTSDLSYYVVKKDEKYGVLQSNNQWLIEPIYQRISNIHHNRFYVFDGLKWLYKTCQNETLATINQPYSNIEPDYEWGRYFGMTVSYDGKKGLIDAKGNTILEPLYTFCYSISDELIAAATSGKVIAQTDEYTITTGHLHALFSTSGQQLTPHQYVNMWPVDNNDELVKTTVSLSEKKYGDVILDKSGNVIADAAEEYRVINKTILKKTDSLHYEMIHPSDKKTSSRKLMIEKVVNNRYLVVSAKTSSKKNDYGLIDTLTGNYLIALGNHYINANENYIINKNMSNKLSKTTVYNSQFELLIKDSPLRIALINDMMRIKKDDKYYYYRQGLLSPMTSQYLLNSLHVNGYTTVDQGGNDVRIIDQNDQTVRLGRFKVLSAFNQSTLMAKKEDRLLLIKLPTVPANDKPSDWAQSEVDKAIASKLVTDNLQLHYQAPITRSQFCQSVITLITKVKNSDIYALAKQEGIDLTNSSFNDARADYIILANKLGIVNGKGANKFDPTGKITRQEAAKMLANTAKYLGVYQTSPSAGFSDKQIANWARAEIDFVKDFAIMNGTAANTFSPLGSFTREQTFITMYRFYHKTK